MGSQKWRDFGDDIKENHVQSTRIHPLKGGSVLESFCLRRLGILLTNWITYQAKEAIIVSGHQNEKIIFSW